MSLDDSQWFFKPLHKPIPKLWRVSTQITVGAVGLMSKIWAGWVNKIQVYNVDTLNNAIENRKKGQPLITLSNHNSCMDEPLLWGTIKLRSLTSRKIIRWSTAAEDVLFNNNYWCSLFFSLGKTVPLKRGAGVYQHGMDFLIHLLNRGSWIHMFPEGKINVYNEAMRLKWGVGRLIADCRMSPIVIPMWHYGMDSLLPNRSPYIPQICKKATLLVGQPMEFSTELEALKAAKKSPIEIRKHITDLIQEEFRTLRIKAEQLHYGKTTDQTL